MASAAHDKRYVLRCAEPAVMRKAAEHVGAGLAEGHLRDPLPLWGDRRRDPTSGPRRISSVSKIFPCLELRRIERDGARAPIDEPRESQTRRGTRRPRLRERLDALR